MSRTVRHGPDRRSTDPSDATDGTLTVNGHARRLDTVTLTEPHAWLAWRRERFPLTANPYLLVNKTTTGGLAPTSRSFVHTACQQAGITARSLRVDRLMAEVHATGGDPLTLTHLFGTSDPTAIRYCAELTPLDQELN